MSFDKPAAEWQAYLPAMPANRTADTLFWTFGAAASLWFMICVIYRIGGDTRSEYFLSGVAGAGLLWGCGWLVRGLLSGRSKLWLATLYDAKALAPIERSGESGDRRRSKRRVKKIARRQNAAGSAKRDRRR
jgi:hypothetical protein